MKKIITVILMFLLCSCTKEVPVEEGYDLSGLTYYNSSDEYDSSEPSKVWFGKDGSFVLTDNIYDGFYEASGSWKVEKDVCTLKVEAGGLGGIETIKFEIADKDKIVLKTTLAGSKADSVFTTDKPQTADLPVTVDDQPCYYKVSDNSCYLILRDDKTFTLNEVRGNEKHVIEGLYGKEGDVLMFSNFDPFTDINGEKQYNFEFFIYDDDTVMAMRDLYASRQNDVFTRSGKLPAGMTEADMQIVHKVVFIQDDSNIYSPQLELSNDGTFVFTENLLAGMGHLSGHYETTGDKITCQVETIDFKGFAGDDTKTIEFEYVDMMTIRLKTQICSSMEGDLFYRAD